MTARKTPIKLRQGWLTHRVYALTRYSERPHPNGAPGQTLIVASEKWDVTEDFEHLVMDLLAHGFNPTHLAEGNGDGKPIGLDPPFVAEEQEGA